MIKIATAVCASAMVFFICYAALGGLQARKNALRRRLHGAQAEETVALPERSGGGRSVVGRLFSGGKADRLEKLGDELYMAGIALKPEEFLSMWVLMGAVLPIVLIMMGTKVIPVVGVTVLGCGLPIAFVKINKAKCLKVFDRQLLDGLTIICNSLRAGFSFQTAMDNIAAEMPDPISREFRRASRECHYGMPLEESLSRLAERTGSEDLEMIVMAVVIQRQVGGNLAEVLDNISGTIRQRIKLRGDIKAMTSSGTMSGYIIGFLPVFLLVAMMVLSPSNVEVFFTTRIGNLLLLLSAVMETVGFVIVRKIVNVKF